MPSPLPTAMILTLLALLTTFIYTQRLKARRRRPQLIPPTQERVLILGASSGVGRTLAEQYAKRGARVCVVSRRGVELERLAAELNSRYGCESTSKSKGNGKTRGKGDSERCFAQAADLSNVSQMCELRDRVFREWDGLDTVLVCAGVSALRPVMGLAGWDGSYDGGGGSEDIGNGDGKRDMHPDASREGIEAAVGIARKAMVGNFDGPLVAALTFIPLLQRTSPSPSILLLNSLASIVPAPTRALYAASKSSSLLLYQALAIEHPGIAFTFILPSTIEGSFRASAVDSGPVREADPNKSGLKREYVAQRCVEAVDGGVTRNVFLPWGTGKVGWFLYGVVPGLVEGMARKKYDFP